MVTRELYEHLPKQRALPQDLMNNVKEVITLKVNSKLLQQKIEASSGQKVRSERHCKSSPIFKGVIFGK